MAALGVGWRWFKRQECFLIFSDSVPVMNAAHCFPFHLQITLIRFQVLGKRVRLAQPDSLVYRLKKSTHDRSNSPKECLLQEGEISANHSKSEQKEYLHCIYHHGVGGRLSDITLRTPLTHIHDPGMKVPCGKTLCFIQCSI